MVGKKVSSLKTASFPNIEDIKVIGIDLIKR